MKLLKTVPAIVMLAGGMFASLNAAADDSVFTVMVDWPPESPDNQYHLFK
jgi:putative salt-induced outer membrane protein